MTGDLTLRGDTIIQPGAVFKVDPGVNIQVYPGCNLTAVGTAEAPIKFTSTKPLGFIGGGNSGPQGQTGPRTETVDLNSYQQVRYVSANTGSDSAGDGSKATPWKSVTYALSQITDASITSSYALLVAHGTYAAAGATIQMKQYVDVYGGFETVGWTRDIDRYGTTLDGEDTTSVVHGANNARLDGFIVIRGNANARFGGGVYCNYSSPSITNNVFSGNTAIANADTGNGGAVCCTGSSSLVRNNLFVGNSATGGGGVSCDYSSPRINNNVFSGNSARMFGGAVSCWMSSPSITNNVFSGNSVFGGGSGGGVYCASSSALVANNIFSGNGASVGGGMFCGPSSSLLITNNVFSGNEASSGGGISCASSSPSITNCIIRGNTPDQIVGLSGGVVTHSNIQGDGFADPTDIDQDPLFVGRIAGGGAASLAWASTSQKTTLMEVSKSLMPDSLRGRSVKVGTREWWCLANTEAEIILAGDATVGGTVDVPVKWEVNDYHLKPTSPCRSTGIGPALNSSVPTTDIDGDIRSGSICDMGADQFNPANAGSGCWGQLSVVPGASSANFDHVTVENGKGIVVEAANTTITNCAVLRCDGDGLKVTAGSAEIATTSATLNAGAGIDAPGRPLRYCVAESNAGTGLSGAALTYCTATRNIGPALSGSGALACSAVFNGGDGLVLSGTATGCVAKENLGRGIRLTSGNATACEATLNTGIGIEISAGGTAAGCRAASNAGGGIVSNGSQVANCTAEGNAGTGITGAGASAVTGSRIVNHSGAAMSGVATVTDCAVSSNKSGITEAQSVTRTYSAENGGVGVGAGSVQGCSILGNSGDGASGTGMVANSHVMKNGGRGAVRFGSVSYSSILLNGGDGASNVGSVLHSSIRSNQGHGVTGATDIGNTHIVENSGTGVHVPDGRLATVNASVISHNAGLGIRSAGGAGAVNGCSILDNGDIGVLDILSLGSSNIHGNGSFEAVDDVSVGSDDRNFTGNYWGAANTAILSAGAEWDNMPFLRDMQDGSGSHMIDVWPYVSGAVQSPSVIGPDDTPPAFLLEVTPNLAESAGVGDTTFTLVFSKAMDMAVQPAVTFGASAPFEARTVQPDPGWADARTWRGRFWVQSDTGDGTNTLRMSGAKAADGFGIPDDTLHQFVIDTDSGLSANNGLASAITPNRVFVQWSESGKSALLNGYNVLRSTDGVSYAQINGALLTEPAYLDAGAPETGGVSYKVMAVNAGANANQWGEVMESFSLPRTGSADLRVALVGPTAAVGPGQEMVFTVSAANDGPDDATVPDIVEMFPPDLVTVTNVTVPADCTETHAYGLVSIQLPSPMAAGTTFTATVRAVCSEPFTLTHHAQR